MDDLSAPAKATAADVIATARTLATEFRHRAAETERLRRLPDENAAALRESGLIRVCMPREYGGYELGWDVFCEAAMELARGCASTAWCYAVYGEHAHRVGHYPAEAQDEVWGDGPDVLIASGNSPESVLEETDGGFRLNGRFNFSSGCDHATWHITGSMKARRQIMYRAEDREIDDNWHAAGLAGTGSKDVVVRNAFVPAYRTYPFGPGGRFDQGGLWRLPQWSAFPFDLASVPVGVAFGVIDRFTGWMSGRSSRFGDKIADFQSLQLRLAESSAEAEAAKRVILHDLRESQAWLEDHDELGPHLMNRNKRDMAFACRLALNAVDRLFYAAGAAALFESSDLQRCFRDAHAGAAQLALNWDINLTDYGRVQLGLEPPSPRK